MTKWFEKVVDFPASKDLLRRRPYGRIEAVNGRFCAIQLRPWPKLISASEVSWFGGWSHDRVHRDRVLLYYSQPYGHRNFLALKYVVSTLGTSLRTLRVAVRMLDEIAILKHTDAIVCEASNARLDDRMMKYGGFERHLEGSGKRHYIRRFYGTFPRSRWAESSVETPEVLGKI